MITIILSGIVGILSVFMLGAIYAFIKNRHCYRLSMQISDYVFCYNVFAAERYSDMIDYDIDCYTTSLCWLNPFKCWTKRGMVP